MDELPTIGKATNRNPKQNEVVERYRFFARNQEPGENIDCYIAILTLLSASCNFGALQESLIRDRIVCGVRDSSLRERLLKTDQLTLKTCEKICQSAELSKESETSESQADSESEAEKSADESSHNQKALLASLPKHKLRKCRFCGKRHIFGKEQCPAYGRVCVKCHKLNHFASECRSTTTRVKHYREKDEKEMTSNLQAVLLGTDGSDESLATNSDGEFHGAHVHSVNSLPEAKNEFGGRDCEPIDLPTIPPPETVDSDCFGMFKGIQGRSYFSYMDATLYSMFAFNSVFDAILEYNPPTTRKDISDIKDTLRKTIVNPLRRISFVRADYLVSFQELLVTNSSLAKIIHSHMEEKDPEKFMNALLQELEFPPFMRISRGKNAVMDYYVHQILLDQQTQMSFPSIAELLHLSFIQSDLKLAQMPPCLIIQFPRFWRKNKLFDYIKPTLEMDIKLLIRDTARMCSSCGRLAFMECKDCQPDADDDLIQSFCRDCFKIIHSKESKRTHQEVHLNVPFEFVMAYQSIGRANPGCDDVDRTAHLFEEHQYLMELFSVVCIDAGHSVAFVKTASGDQGEWVFFDSMADREETMGGVSIPEVVHLRNFQRQVESSNLIRDLERPDFRHLKRLVSDAYICFYRPV